MYQPRYRPEIDGLRAIAILSVVAFHARIPVSGSQLFQGGFIGVDVFFVISGYLITSILLKEQQDGRIHLVEFYKRRVLRIFPALLVVLVFCLIVGRYTLFTDEYAALSKDVAAGAGFVSNFDFWLEAGYFDRAATAKPLLNLWSLSVEEQYYLAFPVALLLLMRVTPNRLTLWFGTAIVLSLLCTQIGSTRFPVANFFLLPSRIWELLCGALLAKLQSDYGRISTALLRSTMPTVGLLSIVAAVVLYHPGIKHPSLLTLLPVCGAMLIIWFANEDEPTTRLLSGKPLVAIGLLSYSLYLWHWPLLSFLYIAQSGEPAWTLRAAAVLASFALAALVYLFVERPMRFGMFRNAKVVATVSLIAAVGVYAATNAATPVLQREVDRKILAGNCSYLIPNLAPKLAGCWISKLRKPDVAIVGDSHTDVLFDSLTRALPDHSVAGIVYHSCLPFASDAHMRARRCEEVWDSTVNILATEGSINTVILAGYWAYLAAGSFGEQGLGWRLAADIEPEAAASFKATGTKMLSKLRQANKDVIIVLDTPAMHHDIRRCSAKRPFSFGANKSATDCAISRRDFEMQAAAGRRLIGDLAATDSGVQLFDPADVLCGPSTCDVLRGGKSLYSDGDHLSKTGADLVVRALLSKHHLGD